MTPSTPQCPDLEVLFIELEAGHGPALEHAEGCPLCAAVLEEHRQLEKDLFRLADPLPPPDLVHQVMARVAASPAPAPGVVDGPVHPRRLARGGARRAPVE